MLLLVHEGPSARGRGRGRGRAPRCARTSAASRPTRARSSTGSSTATRCRASASFNERGLVVDTIEVAATWDRVLPLYHARRRVAARGPRGGAGERALESHVPLGHESLLHVRRAGRGPGAHARRSTRSAGAARCRRRSRRAAASRTTTASAACGATHLRARARRHAASRCCAALKRALDPDDLLNPGVLLPRAERAREPSSCCSRSISARRASARSPSRPTAACWRARRRRSTTRYPRPGLGRAGSRGDVDERSTEVLRAALAERARSTRATSRGSASSRSARPRSRWDARSAARRSRRRTAGRTSARAERVAGLRARACRSPRSPRATKFEWWLQARRRGARGRARAARCASARPTRGSASRLGATAPLVTDPGNASCTALYDVARGRVGAGAARPVRRAARGAARGRADQRGGRRDAARSCSARRSRSRRARATSRRRRSRRARTRAGDAKLTLGTSAMLDVHTGESLARAACPAPIRSRSGARPTARARSASRAR